METGNKIQPIYSLSDSSLTKETAVTYFLSIFLGFDKCISIVFDEDSQKVIAFSDVESSQLTEVLKEISFLRYEYKRVEIILQNSHVSLIPSSVFNENQKDNYLNISYYKLKEEKSYSYPLSNTEAVAVFFEKQQCVEELEDSYPNMLLKHSSNSFIDSMLLKTKNIKGEFIYTHVNKLSFELLIIRNGELLLYNFFEYKTAEDFSYFLLFSCEQLKLDVEKLNLFFSGKISKESKIFQLIYTYIRNVNFLMPPDCFNYSSPLQEIPKHMYSKFFYHFTCV